MKYAMSKVGHYNIIQPTTGGGQKRGTGLGHGGSCPHARAAHVSQSRVHTLYTHNTNDEQLDSHGVQIAKLFEPAGLKFHVLHVHNCL